MILVSMNMHSSYQLRSHWWHWRCCSAAPPLLATRSEKTNVSPSQLYFALILCDMFLHSNIVLYSLSPNLLFLLGDCHWLERGLQFGHSLRHIGFGPSVRSDNQSMYHLRWSIKDVISREALVIRASFRSEKRPDLLLDKVKSKWYKSKPTPTTPLMRNKKIFLKTQN